MSVSSQALYDTVGQSDSPHTLDHLEALEMCSRGPRVDTHDYSGSIRLEEKILRYEPVKIKPREDTENNIGTGANPTKGDILVPGVGTQTQRATAASKLKLHAALLDSLRHLRQHQDQERLENGQNCSIDRSPLSFAAALEILETRMGKV